MKRYVFSMSKTRHKSLKELDALSTTLVEHICKYILYKDIRPDDREHWIDEIAEVLEYVSGTTVKTRKKKLKASEYREWLFGDLGDEAQDLRGCLWITMRSCIKKTPPYPKVNLEDINFKLEFVAVQKMIDECSNKLSETNIYHKNAWKDIIHRYLQ